MFGARSVQACLLVVAFHFASVTPLHAQGNRGTLTGQGVLPAKGFLLIA